MTLLLGSIISGLVGSVFGYLYCMWGITAVLEKNGIYKDTKTGAWKQKIRPAELIRLLNTLEKVVPGVKSETLKD